MPNFPVILSGGSGERLWPLSSKHHPKQLLKLTGKYTLLQQTALRLPNINPPIVVCNESHRFMVAEQLHAIDRIPTAIILEPLPRNTAPAIALAAFEALTHNEDAILIVLPADHLIQDISAFQLAVKQATAWAQDSADGAIITFGIVPSHAETGFGYIQAQSSDPIISKITRFVEKPDLATARRYVASGNFYWNSGMFVFKARSLLNEIRRQNLPMFEQSKLAFEHAKRDLDFIRVNKDAFAQCPPASIDYAVMEQTKLGMVLPISVGWSDIGSFSALWQALEKDQSGNINLGHVKNIDCKNCLISSENQFIAAIGLENLLIIGTKDAILVAKKDRAQDIKAIVSHLQQSDRTKHLL